MKVRITDFTGMELWYRNKIGKVFEVEEAISDGWYRVVSSVKYIKVKDCRVIPEEGVIGVDAPTITREQIEAKAKQEYAYNPDSYTVTDDVLTDNQRDAFEAGALWMQEQQSLISKIESNAAKP